MPLHHLYDIVTVSATVLKLDKKVLKLDLIDTKQKQRGNSSKTLISTKLPIESQRKTMLNYALLYKSVINFWREKRFHAVQTMLLRWVRRGEHATQFAATFVEKQQLS